MNFIGLLIVHPYTQGKGIGTGESDLLDVCKLFSKNQFSVFEEPSSAVIHNHHLHHKSFQKASCLQNPKTHPKIRINFL
jgi:hypothetical protein